MAKSNIRSMRFSDDIVELIEAQAGETFTAKFEALVTRCVRELPEKEKQLQQIEERIQERRELLHRLSSKCRNMENSLNNIKSYIESFERSIDKEA